MDYTNLNWLKNYISSLTGDKELVDDIFQNTILTALLKNDQIRIDSAQKSWLMTVARNELYTYYRKNSRFSTFEDYNLIDDSNTESEDNDLKRSNLHNSIYKLPPILKNSVFYKYFCQMSIEDIADFLSLPAGTVKRRLFDAKNKIRKDIEMNLDQNKFIRPELKIIPSPVEQLTVRLNGDPTFLISNLEIGRVELYDHFVYGAMAEPFWHYRSRSVVKGIKRLMGKDLYEVSIEYTQCDDMDDRILFFAVEENRLSPILRIYTNPEVKVESLEDERMWVNRTVCTGITENGYNKAVDVLLGTKEFKNAICLTEAYPDSDYYETIITNDGQLLADRIFISENRKLQTVSWEALEKSEKRFFNNIEYRLCNEWIFADSYNMNNER